MNARKMQMIEQARTARGEETVFAQLEGGAA